MEDALGDVWLWVCVGDMDHEFGKIRFCVMHPAGDEIRCIFDGDFSYDRGV